MIDELQKRADSLRQEHGFDQNNGTAQLTGPRASQKAAVAYGEFRLCLNLIEQIHDGSIPR